MTLYVTHILCNPSRYGNLCICFFSTGNKHKKIFQDIYFSVEDNKGVGVVYTKQVNTCYPENSEPLQKYSANIDSYYDFTDIDECSHSDFG